MKLMFLRAAPKDGKKGPSVRLFFPNGTEIPGVASLGATMDADPVSIDFGGAAKMAKPECTRLVLELRGPITFERITQAPPEPVKAGAAVIAWPLGICPALDVDAARASLAHWSALSAHGNEWWLRRDGYSYRCRWDASGGWPAELRFQDVSFVPGPWVFGA